MITFYSQVLWAREYGEPGTWRNPTLPACCKPKDPGRRHALGPGKQEDGVPGLALAWAKI